jgi:hypothetical protein
MWQEEEVLMVGLSARQERGGGGRAKNNPDTLDHQLKADLPGWWFVSSWLFHHGR